MSIQPSEHSLVPGGREVTTTPSGTHACIIYDDRAELLSVVVPFLRTGLTANERCLVFGPADLVSEIEGALLAVGIDVVDEQSRGALRLVTESTHLVDGRFDPGAMITGLHAAIAQALADGFAGLRATGDVAWELGSEPDFTLLPAYEAQLDEALAGQSIVGLCQYRRRDYPPESLAAALHTHKEVVLDTRTVSPNPYHEPPQVLLHGERSAADRFDRMAGSLREGEEACLRREEEARREMREVLSRETRDRLARVLEEMGDAFVALDRGWRVTFANAEALRIAGRRAEEFVGALLWDICPDGRDSLLAREFERSVADQVATRLEYRSMANGSEKWLDINAYPSPDGLSVFYRDITARKQAERQQALLMREVDHRAKNALAVAQSIVMLTRAQTMPDFIAAVEGRIAALARVHTLLARERWSGADLRTIVLDELSPFSHGDDGRVVALGPDVTVLADAAQPVGMVLHELATNAAKYGALSVPGGTIAVHWTVEPDGSIELLWREQGGPPVPKPTRRGFGAQMIVAAVAGQLDGQVDFQWRPDGLRCAITIAAARVRAASSAAGSVPTPAPASRPVGLAGRRVLVADDDSLVAMGMQLALEDLGCTVVGPATTLEGALRLAAAEVVDVAVLDVNLRGRETWTVADVLLARKVPYVFTSGYGDMEAEAAARGAKVLVKPFHPDQLAPALREILAPAA